jgi:mannose-6-phosphate isomerase-like protein (cupin superfamily)
MTDLAGFDLIGNYIHLEVDGGAVLENVSKDFWSQIGKRPYKGNRLVAITHTENDSTTWEMHPAGDELLYLLSGAIDIVLEEEHGERVLELTPGVACIIPRNVWHRQIIHKPSDLLFITPGEGTQHRRQIANSGVRQVIKSGIDPV